MEMTENQKKFFNSADKKLRKGEGFISGARKDMDIVLKEESNSNKSRRQETADPDGCTTEVPESKED